MERLSEEQIIKEMEGIHEVDLQKRLKEYYLEREKYKDKNHEELQDRYRIIIENNELLIKVYEKKLPDYVIERAKRSAGLFKTQEEIDESVRREKIV